MQVAVRQVHRPRGQLHARRDGPSVRRFDDDLAGEPGHRRPLARTTSGRRARGILSRAMTWSRSPSIGPFAPSAPTGHGVVAVGLTHRPRSLISGGRADGVATESAGACPVAPRRRPPRASESTRTSRWRRGRRKRPSDRRVGRSSVPARRRLRALVLTLPLLAPSFCALDPARGTRQSHDRRILHRGRGRSQTDADPSRPRHRGQSRMNVAQGGPTRSTCRPRRCATTTRSVWSAPARKASGYRQYVDADIHRLRFVQRTRALGLLQSPTAGCSCRSTTTRGVRAARSRRWSVRDSTRSCSGSRD